jgi:hypothetical protein
MQTQSGDLIFLLRCGILPQILSVTEHFLHSKVAKNVTMDTQ